MAQILFEEVQQSVVRLVSIMKTVTKFQIRPEIIEGLDRMATQVEENQIQLAIRTGQMILESGHAVLSVFFLHSVIDWMKDGSPKLARFTVDLNWRRDKKGYDRDLIERIEKSRKMLEEAVKTETNGTFDSRRDAYNAMCETLVKVDQEQSRREQVRRVQIQTNRRQDVARSLRALV